MINNIEALKQILTIFKNNNLTDNIILVGSWCELFYEDYFDDYHSLMKTQDYDFFIKNDNKIKRKVNLVEEFDHIGFYPQIDYITSKIKFLNKDANEIEFITDLKRGGNSPVEIKKLNINAEALPYFDFTYAYSMHVKLDDTDLIIPTPQAYVIQKILINEKRNDYKQEKDIISISTIYQQILQSDKEKLLFKEIYNSGYMSKKGRNKITKFLNDLELDVSWLNQ